MSFPSLLHCISKHAIYLELMDIRGRNSLSFIVFAFDYRLFFFLFRIVLQASRKNMKHYMLSLCSVLSEFSIGFNQFAGSYLKFYLKIGDLFFLIRFFRRTIFQLEKFAIFLPVDIIEF